MNKNLRNKKVAVTGADGFIGKHLVAALKKHGAEVHTHEGDVRNMSLDWLNHTFSYFFHFGSPSSQILFARNPRYCWDVTINSFSRISNVCRKYDIKLIYPSTGLLSQGKTNDYASAKKACESIHLHDGLNALGLRIFATYGPGEELKRDYASVPFLFLQDIVNRKTPTVFGNGHQKRDFIYIDDVIEAILILAEEANEPIIDVGSGKPKTFLEILKVAAGKLNRVPTPIFIKAPENYVEETAADTRILERYYSPLTSFEAGINRTIDYLLQQK